MRKNHSRLASKIRLSKPMHKPKDFSKYKQFLYIGKNRSRLTVKKGLSKPMHKPKDFSDFKFLYILFFLSLYICEKIVVG